MAVKVMVASAITKGDVARTPARERLPPAAKAPRAKRRRSSVYDADGNEVFITLVCLKCQKIRPLSQFGLRKMADGSIRNQPWCRTCRSAPSMKGPKPAEGTVEPEESSLAGESPASAASSTPAAEEHSTKEHRRNGSVAAEVAAALAAGRS